MRQYLKQLALLTAIGFMLCSTGCVKRYLVRVDAINRPIQNLKNTYTLQSGMPNISEQDLNFNEFSKYIETVMQWRGYQQVPLEKADLVVFLKYGLSEPRQYQEIYTSPVYGGYYYGSFYRGYYGAFGTEINSRSYDVYTKFMSLEAFDGEQYRNWKDVSTAQQLKESPVPPLTQAWKLTVNSEGRSDDLRKLMPVFAAVGYDYIGSNTGGKVSVRINEEDRRLINVRTHLPLPVMDPKEQAP